jgi:hypothetical protein
MRTKIVALFSAFVFLVFMVLVNLSCQKDNSVESAGNNSKDKITSGNRNNGDRYEDCNDPDRYFRVTMKLYKHSDPNVPIKTYTYEHDAYSVAEPYGEPYTLPYEMVDTKYDLYLKFEWFNCLPICNGTYWNSNSPLVAHFILTDDLGRWIFWSCLHKPFGAKKGFENNLVSGYDEYRFESLENNVWQLTPGNTYGFCAYWDYEFPYLGKTTLSNK